MADANHHRHPRRPHGPVHHRPAVRAAIVGVVLVAVSSLAACVPTSPRSGHRHRPSTSTSTSTSTTTLPPPSTATASTTTTTLPPVTTPSTTPVGEAVLIRRGDPTRAVVALTFDAGSDRGNAEEILDTLGRLGVPAAFGVTGAWARANPDLTQRIGAAGHLIINHSDRHPSFTGFSTGTGPLGSAARLAELDAADAAIAAATGHTTKPWFRPPYGDTDTSVQDDVGAAGYHYEVLWTVDSLGWQGLASDAITQRCLDLAVPGAIYLFHVGGASQDAAALESIVAGLRARGYSFVSIPELVADLGL